MCMRMVSLVSRRRNTNDDDGLIGRNVGLNGLEIGCYEGIADLFSGPTSVYMTLHMGTAIYFAIHEDECGVLGIMRGPMFRYYPISAYTMHRRPVLGQVLAG